MNRFFRGKKVFVTGHTGFKGVWLCELLVHYGAEVYGYALSPISSPNLYTLSNINQDIQSIIGDIRDFDHLSSVIKSIRPEIIIHLAAQPIVRESYADPRYTYETNVMGTVNILESMRIIDSVKSFLNVTTDKVYRNNEWIWGYREDEYLDGYDPYSNSKSCSELITAAYYRCFGKENDVAISTARAGNVIGGGDFAKDRIIPDCIRAVERKDSIVVRNPFSIRPYQHVLDPINAYLLIIQRQYEDAKYSGSYNVGPNEIDCISTGKLVDLFCRKWGDCASWTNVTQVLAPHEANTLKLDCAKIKTLLGWSPRWNIDIAIEKICEWTKAYLNNENISEIMVNQIKEFLNVV